ncbi:hypothetical protein [Streptomyces longispororuber]|uniref:hypothetical protein n=1 Tax=Streptomyces longispororuber TaxID=68230 RepID=UPI0036F5F55E
MPRPSFICPACQHTSHHPADVEYGYCGRCQRYTRAEAAAARALAGLAAARAHAASAIEWPNDSSDRAPQ